MSKNSCGIQCLSTYILSRSALYSTTSCIIKMIRFPRPYHEYIIIIIFYYYYTSSFSGISGLELAQLLLLSAFSIQVKMMTI